MRARANLFPEQLAQRWREDRWSRWALAIAVLPGLVLLMLASLTCQMATERATVLQQANRQRASDAATLIQGGWLRAENERLAPTRALAVASHTNLAAWSAVLRELRDRIPADAWLVEVSIARSDFDAARPQQAASGPQVVVLKGGATRAAAVGQYLDALVRSPLLRNARLESSGPSTLELAGPEPRTPAVDFELRAELRHTIAEGQP